MAAKNMTDMTSGSPVKHIIRFALPLLLGNLFQQLYNMVDSLVVGNYVGADALAAVGACDSVNFLFFSLCLGLSTGIGVIVSQYYGAKEEENIRKTIANAIYVLLGSAIVFSVLGMLTAPSLLRLLQTPERIIGDAVIYMRTTCAGIIAIALYNGVAAILRALGDSKTPLYFLVLACIINVILDLIFVLVFHWAVFGVAFATIIAQVVSAIVCIFYAYKKVPYFRLKKEEMRPRKDIIRRSFVLGVPIGLQNALIAISCMALQSVVNSFGETVMAAFTVINRVEQVVQQPYGSLSIALTTYTGQNIGAGQVERVKQGYRQSVIMALVFSLALIPIAFLFGGQIIGWFVKDAEVIAIGSRGLCINCFFYFALGMIYVPRALLNGVGDAGFAMMNGATEVAGRILFSRVLTKIPGVGYWGIWWTTGATWTLAAVVCVIRYKRGKWQNMSMIDKS